MAKSRRKSKGKKINPTLWVFCEGETEESYVNFLKSLYRISSIQIHSKVKGNAITTKFISAYKQDKPTHDKDINYLVYDLDVAGMHAKLEQIGDCVLLVSNPCIELWFLLHYKNQKSAIDSKYCCRELSNRNKKYSKGSIDNKLYEKLKNKISEATKRAKELPRFINPSSTMYIFIEKLEELKNNQ